VDPVSCSWFYRELAAIDWMMSLEPKWYSTIFGMIFMVSFGLAGLALAILATILETEKPSPRLYRRTDG
jgi:hypothetical protein